MLLKTNVRDKLIIYRKTSDVNSTTVCSICKKSLKKTDHEVRHEVNKDGDEMICHEKCYKEFISNDSNFAKPYY